MTLESRINKALSTIKQPKRRAAMREGIKEELEHGKTVRWLKKHPKATVVEAAKKIAQDHLQEDPQHYDRMPLSSKAKRPAGLKAPRVKLLGRRGKLRIYLVDGKWVREHKHIDFVHGGHDVVYPDFVDPWEVWLDDTLLKNEIPYVMWHELYERRRMSRDGLDYNTAHDLASKYELEWRHGKKGFKQALAKERGQ